MIHTPVLLNEVLEILNPQPGGRYIDGTVNGGGHAQEILDRIGESGSLLGIDRDGALIDRLKKKFENKKNLIAVCDSYAHLDEIAPVYGFGSVNGILFDLGFSSYHVDRSGRGFSFLRDEPLDMRYDTEKNRLTAGTIVNTWSQAELARIAKEYGQERFAGHIAAAITRERSRKRIQTTYDLVRIIRESIPRAARHGKIHPATRMFQSLRIAVNDELSELRQGLEKGIDLLVPGGKMAVVSFHSLEDGIVKHIFRSKNQEGIAEIITKKPITVTAEELRINPRARSAKLRAIIKKTTTLLSFPDQSLSST